MLRWKPSHYARPHTPLLLPSHSRGGCSLKRRDKVIAARKRRLMVASGSTTSFAGVLQQFKAELTNNWPLCAGLAAGLYCMYKLVTFLRADADLELLSKRKPPKNAFADKVVWITGASQGLGEELAKQFAAQGAYLILSSRNAARLEAVKAECHGKHAPGEVVVLPLDVTSSYEELKEAAAKADEAFGSGTAAKGVHYLVHNAGASQRAPVEETSPEVVEALYELNVRGTLNLTRAALPMLLARALQQHPRRIVIVGSMAGQMPAPGQAVYAACKASLDAYFRTLHSELSSRGVQVVLCHPGPIATRAAGQMRSLYGSSGLLQVSDDEKEVKRRQSPERVAELILRACYHGTASCWISKHPVLLIAYLVKVWPSVGYAILNRVGPARANSYRSGGGGYSMSLLTKGGKKAS